MINNILSFLAYMAVGGALLAAFMFVYEKFTPYRELQLIKAGNVAASIAFAGAILGFTFPLISVVFYTHSLVEMVKWALVTGAVQLLVFEVVQRMWHISDCIKEGRVSSAILYASIAISTGLLNAISVSY
jgi:putative membrane protein